MHSCFDLIMNFSMNYFTSIEILNGSNYYNWKKDVEYSFENLWYYLTLREDKSMINSDSRFEQKKLLAKWERSNRLNLIAIKKTVSKHLLSGLPEKVIVLTRWQVYQFVLSNKRLESLSVESAWTLVVLKVMQIQWLSN